jgi:hypothetical protein
LFCVKVKTWRSHRLLASVNWPGGIIHQGSSKIGDCGDEVHVGGDNEVGLRRQAAVRIEDQKKQRTQPRALRGSSRTRDLFHRAVHIIIGGQKVMRKSRGHFVCLQSARGLAHSMTLRAVCKSPGNASRLGLRRPSAAFPRGVSNGAQVNWTCFIKPQIPLMTWWSGNF